ncbi:EamA family transporter [Stella sp.]|uniref:EamA family transporter n=1 Tax=Stella sp. TaxID=2912054 RepID=UPI0035B39F58
MDGIVVAAALLSALLHAAWNAAVKAAPDPQAAMAAQVVASGILSVPALLVLPLPSPEALPWLAASTSFNLLAMLAMVRGYNAGGGFGLVYPLTRATSPLLVTLLATALFGERLGPVGLAGVVLVSAGVAMFAVGDARRHRAALLSALAAGIFSAAYAVCDAQGARLSPSTLGYGFAMSAVNAVMFGTVHRLRGGVPLIGALRRHLLLASLGSTGAILSYLLILWVWSQAPVALGAALRDTSVVFAALIAAVVLKERVTARRAAAIGLVACGAAALRFA